MVKINANLFKQTWKDTWQKGIGVGVIALVLAWVINLTKIKPLEITMATIDIRQQIARQGAFPQIGQRVVDFFQNIIPVMDNVPAFVGLIAVTLIGSVLALYLGTILYKLMGEFKIGAIGKGKPTKLALELILGFAMLSIGLIWATGIGFWNIIVAMFIYYVIIALIMGLLANAKIIRVA